MVSYKGKQEKLLRHRAATPSVRRGQNKTKYKSSISSPVAFSRIKLLYALGVGIGRNRISTHQPRSRINLLTEETNRQTRHRAFRNVTISTKTPNIVKLIYLLRRAKKLAPSKNYWAAMGPVYGSLFSNHRR